MINIPVKINFNISSNNVWIRTFHKSILNDKKKLFEEVFALTYQNFPLNMKALGNGRESQTHFSSTSADSLRLAKTTFYIT